MKIRHEADICFRVNRSDIRTQVDDDHNQRQNVLFLLYHQPNKRHPGVRVDVIWSPLSVPIFDDRYSVLQIRDDSVSG